LFSQFARAPNVVVVEKSNPITVCCPNSRVSGRRQSAPIIAQNHHARIRSPNFVSGAVGAAVVYQNDLGGSDGLLEDRPQRLCEKPSGVAIASTDHRCNVTSHGNYLCVRAERHPNDNIAVDQVALS
jgi:hypothetical protein